MALEMKLKLNAPGMTSLHKAGLAGLYMTLKAFDKNKEVIEGLKWELEDKQITLHWIDETPKNAFKKLIDKSFQVKDGFIRLYGLEATSKEQLHLLYESLLNSFLQYGKHRQKKGKINLGYEIDDKKIWIKDFEPLTDFIHQKTGEKWIDKNGLFISEVEVPGWLYPGASKRHNVHNITINKEPIHLALPLLFAPVGVIYYLIRSKARGRKSRLALLIPEIKNLKSYSEVRRFIASQGVIDLTASSSSDAALRMLIALKATAENNEFAEEFEEHFLCRIVTFGIVGWSEQQKTRTATHTVVSGRLKGFENYNLANRIFKNKWQQVKEKGKSPEHYFITTFCMRELVADNTANNKNWYHNISGFMTKPETRKQIYYERKEVGEMVEKASYEEENRHLFIKVCHESWRRRLGKLGERARRERTDFQTLVRKEAEKMRTSIARCKNAENLRETIINFWSRGGSNKLLYKNNGLESLLPLFDEKNWREAKDLALLALISYKPQTKEEKQALEDIDEDTGEENDE